MEISLIKILQEQGNCYLYEKIGYKRKDKGDCRMGYDL